MAAAQQVGNAFTVDFVERVAKNSANLAELYGRRATLTINDFELGISEVSDSEVPLAAQKWAASLQDSRLRVDSVNSAPVYGGVNVFVTLTALGALQQYFHVATTLESYQDTFGMDGFYVRHQVIARIGAVAAEAPAAPEPTPAAEEAPAQQTPAPEPAQKTPTPEPQPEPAPEAAEEAVAAPAPAEEEAPQPATAAAAAPAATPAAAPSSAKPKSWASLLSSAPTKTAEHRPIHVVAREAGDRKEAAAASKKEAAAPREAAVKRPAPRERKAPEPVGDRLMFNITGTVTDDEIRAALGASAAHLVSLRNNSAKGHVFMDFAENVAVLDELTKAQPVIGAAKLKVSVFRQRPRD